jgi:hypothetical protein
MDDYISLFSAMDHDRLMLTLKLLALAVVLGLGLLRIHLRIGDSERDHRNEVPAYDMRRDGQRLTT